jgi:Uma2 family endonuclease
MTSLTAERLLTAEEFHALPDDPAGRKLELLDGRVIFVSQPGEQHADVAFRILLALHQFASANRLGKVRNDVGFQLRENPDRVVAPDVGFIANEQLSPVRDVEKHFTVPPTLAVEVVSPSDIDEDVFGKVIEYLAAGSQRVWVVRPGNRSVTVHSPDGTALTHIRSGTLTSEDAGFTAPGFELTLDQIFAGGE